MKIANKTLNIVLVENEGVCRLNVKNLLSKCKNINLIATAVSLAEANNFVLYFRPHIVIINDLNGEFDSNSIIECFATKFIGSTYIKLSKYIDFVDGYKYVKEDLLDELADVQFLDKVYKNYYYDKINEHYGIYDPMLIDKNHLLQNRELIIKNYLIVISDLLIYARIPTHLSGYKYLREAILTTLEFPLISMTVTKVLYPLIAERFNTTYMAVERNIRHAIRTGYKKDKFKALYRYLGLNHDNETNPSNSEFIGLLVDRVRISVSLNDAKLIKQK